MKTSTRVGIYIAVFISLTIILGYASTAPMGQTQAQNLVGEVQAISPTTFVIYDNNLRIALIEFVPILGPVYGAISSYDTGLVLSATGQVPNATTTGLFAFVITILTPIFWLEFSCYTLAVEESIAILVSIKNRDLPTREWKWLVCSLLFVAAVLFVSARLEVAMINFLK